MRNLAISVLSILAGCVAAVDPQLGIPGMFPVRPPTTAEHLEFVAACDIDKTLSADDTVISLIHHKIYYAKGQCENYSQDANCSAFVINLEDQSCSGPISLRDTPRPFQLDDDKTNFPTRQRQGIMSEIPVLMSSPTGDVVFFEWPSSFEITDVTLD